jgi:hypothetical protein
LERGVVIVCVDEDDEVVLAVVVADDVMTESCVSRRVIVRKTGFGLSDVISWRNAEMYSSRS